MASPYYDEDDEVQGEWAEIPGIDALSREALLGFDVYPLGPFDDADEKNARLMWDYSVRAVLADHPQIGVAGSAANGRVVELFHAMGKHGEPIGNLRNIVEFVMIYPQKSQRSRLPRLFWGLAEIYWRLLSCISWPKV